MIIGLCGLAGSGKDTIAEMLAPVHLVDLNGNFVDVRTLLAAKNQNGTAQRPPLRVRSAQVAMADPLKEFCHRVYDFSIEQLWGPSAKRNAPDMRYKRTYPVHNFAQKEGYTVFICKRCGRIAEGVLRTSALPLTDNTMLAPPDLDEGCEDFLSPREALQQLGTEWGRRMWGDTWVHSCLHRAHDLLQRSRLRHPEKDATYSGSWIVDHTELVIISDVRYPNEVAAIHARGGEIWFVDRKEAGLEGAAGQHGSETAIEGLRAKADTIIENDGSLDALYLTIGAALAESGL